MEPDAGWIDPSEFSSALDGERLIEAQVAEFEWIIGTPLFDNGPTSAPGEIVVRRMDKTPVAIEWVGGRFPWDRVIAYRVFDGWRWNDPDHYETFFPIQGHDEKREVYALLDQSMLGDEEDDEINIPQVIIGNLDSDFCEDHPVDGPIYSWMVRTPDGPFDLGTRIAAWRFVTKLLPGMI